MAAIDVSGGGGAGISLTKDIFVNTSLIGAFDATEDVNVFLQDPGANPITPVSSVLVGNDLTITANIPVPAGAALQFPNPASGISYYNYDSGWRAQNGWYNYTPPSYPAKYAQLDTAFGAAQWYKLKTALTVNGVTSTERFVDANGVQSWGTLDNVNFAVIDKLTGLMFTRTPVFIVAGGPSWQANIAAAYAYSTTIKGVTYSNWYTIGVYEFMALFGMYLPNTTNWTDPTTSQNIVTGISQRFVTADAWGLSPGASCQGYTPYSATQGMYEIVNTNTANQQTFWIHDATTLIS